MTRSTPEEPEVRRAVVADAPGIARCQGSCWAEAYAGLTRHGSGLADELLAASLGPGRASLWVFEDNPRARAFYARQGFRTDGASAVDGWTGLREVRMLR